MILNLVVLLFVLFQQIYSYSQAEDDNATSLSDIAARFANLDFINQDETLIQLFLYDEPGEDPMIIPHYDNEEIIEQIVTTRKTYVLFNGHPSADSTEPYMVLKDTLFKEGKVNIFFVYIDWTGHSISFLDAITLSGIFGQFVGDILKQVRIPNENLHFIAHCAGAEVGTSVARRLFSETGRKVPRMTVFDPFVTNSTKLFHANDYINFVDVYHAGIYDPPFAPVGDVDYYINAGIRQPGCVTEDVLQKFICHHRRSIYLYEESINTDVNAIEAYFDNSEKHLRVTDDPRTILFGHRAEKNVKGAFYLPTYYKDPFLMEYF